MAKRKIMTWEEALSPYDRDILTLIKGYGGSCNEHTHLCRAGTNGHEYWEHCGVDPEEASGFPLAVKQMLIGELHRGLAYTPKNLFARMSMMLEKAIAFHTKRVVSFIDVSDDNVGLTAVEAAIKVQEAFKERIDFQIGLQPIFGFKDWKEPKRWELYLQAAKMPQVSILGGLPEVDNKPDRIGFKEHCWLIIEKAIELDKEVHVHLDQKNSPYENGTEMFLDVVEAIDAKIRAKSLGKESIIKPGRPFIWIIHEISPSCYDEERFSRLAIRQKKLNVGAICCLRAAISMLQLRPIKAYLHNSTARVLELVKHEVPVRIGTDNIADIFIPTGDINMLKEVGFLPDVFRYYAKKLWVKLACGVPVNKMDIELIKRALYQDSKSFAQIKQEHPELCG